jgi:hypothetical protein
MSLSRCAPILASMFAVLAAPSGCGSPPSNGATCIGGTPAAGGRCIVAIATDQYSPVALAADDSSVYWANSGDGTIAWAPAGLDLGGPVVLATGQNVPRALAVDETSVYWTTSDGNIVSAPKPPTSPVTPTVLATRPASTGLGSGELSGLVGLTTNGYDLFWGEFAGTIGQPQSRVMTITRAGGTPVVVATQPGVLVGIASDASHVYWAMLVPTDPDLTQAVGEILSAPAAGGDSTVLATTDSSLGAIVVDGQSVYFAAGGAIESVAIGGGPVVELATASGVTAIATDGVSVYWTDTGGAVSKVPVGGEAATTIGQSRGGEVGAVGSAGVFLLPDPLLGSGEIVQITPK